MPVIRDLVVDIGLTIRRLKSIAHGGRVLSSIPAQAAGRILSAVRLRARPHGPPRFQWPPRRPGQGRRTPPGAPVSYTHLRAHETPEHLVCRLLLEKKKNA